MKRLVAVTAAALVAGGAWAKINYYTAASNNVASADANWSAPWADWDDAVVADAGWTVRNSGTAHADMKYNTLVFNSAVNASTGSEFIWNTLAGITNFYRGHIAMDADVEKNCRLGGPLAVDGAELRIVQDSTLATLQMYAGIVATTNDVAYSGATGGVVELGGGAVNSAYVGTTVLDAVTANLLVGGVAAKGPFGHGGNAVVLTNGATLALGTQTILNPVSVPAGATANITSGNKTHTFNLAVDGGLLTSSGTRWFNGTLSGSGTVAHTAGTVVFNNTAMDSVFDGTLVFRNIIVQSRASNPFGTAKVVLEEGANFRGFNDQVGETIAIPNDIEIDPTNSTTIVRMASTGIASSSPHTVVGNIVFAADGRLSLQATANSASVDDTTLLDVAGAISDGAGVGNIIIDNKWAGTSYTNGRVRFFGANTYSGTTTIEDGTLQLMDGASIANTSALAIDAIGRLVANGNLALPSATTLAFSSNGVHGVVAGADGDEALAVSGVLFMDDAELGSGDVGTAYPIFQNFNSISGSLAVSSLSGGAWSLNLAAGTATLTQAGIGRNPAFDAWAAGFDLSGTDALPQADPDGDGVNNFYEYAFGGNPTNPAFAGYLPAYRSVAAGGTNWFEFVYARRTDAGNGLTYTLELSDNLIYSPWGTAGIQFAGAGAIDSAIESVTNRTPADATAKYFKLTVENQ